MLGQSDRRQGIGTGLGRRSRPLKRIDCDIHLRTAGTDLLTDEQHRCLVHLALADHHCSFDRHGVERLAHGFHRRAIGLIFVAETNPTGGCDSRRLGDADELQRQIPVGLYRLFIVGHEFPLSGPRIGPEQRDSGSHEFSTDRLVPQRIIVPTAYQGITSAQNVMQLSEWIK